MFCNQCEETVGGVGCTKAGVCGKTGEVADLQDVLLYVLKGLAHVNRDLRSKSRSSRDADLFMIDSLFSTITNTNFDKDFFMEKIKQGIELRKKLDETGQDLPDYASWDPEDDTDILEKAKSAGIHVENDDISSLKEILLFGLKGLAAYLKHADVLGYDDDSVFAFLEEGLIATIEEKSAEEMMDLIQRCGEAGIAAMELLDRANTETYGKPEPTSISIDVGKNPGILISGHDLKDLEVLLEQSKDSGVDIYTHGEMLPSHAYPFFKKYPHFRGNYGGAWWNQIKEFTSFNGPILMTTNCLVPPAAAYKDRIYTTGVVGFSDIKHIDNHDFRELIEQAKTLPPPEKIEDGTIMAGFAHDAILSNADKIVDLVKQGRIRRFVVMAGCDGRHKEREYYTQFAKALPKDTIILTAGCAKYRYNKLDLGDIDGIPRVLDAGQCNDSYSLLVVAMKLAEVFDTDINSLPISYNIAWYEQKAVLVLLALLSKGVKNIVLGPRLPAFVSPNVLDTLVKAYNISPISTVEEDIKRLVP